MYNNVYKIYSRKGETQLLKQSIIKRGNEISHYLIKIRRDLHRTPELAMEEFVTKKKIKKYLSISHCIDFVRHGKNMYQKLLVCGVAINSHVIKYILDDMGLLKIIYSR